VKDQLASLIHITPATTTTAAAAAAADRVLTRSAGRSLRM